MKNYLETYEKCKGILDSLEIPYTVGVPIKVNNRLSRAMGRTCGTFAGYNRYGEPTYNFKIELNPAMVEDTVADFDLEDTILHELLHTCPGCQNHGAKWKSYAGIVNRRFGYSISRTGDVKEVQSRIERVNPDRYEIFCSGCGKKIATRKKWCNLTANIGRYRCFTCHGELKVKSLVPGEEIWVAKTNR